MSLQNVSNHKQLFIAKNIARTANLAAAVATPSNLANGEVVVTDLAGRILDTTTVLTVDQVQIVQGQGSTKPLIKSAAIPKTVLVAKTKAYTPANQQISYVGYDGTSNNIVNPGVGTNIILRNTFKTNFFQFSDKLVESIVGLKVITSDTIFTIADKLTKFAIQDVQKYVNIPYKVERLINGTKTAVTAATSGTSRSIFVVASGTTAPTAAVSNGSSAVTFTTAANISSVNFVVGDYIELSGIAYKITALGTTGSTSYTITIDTAYQGTTGTIAAANIKFWNTADYTATGIKFTGLPQTKFAPNIYRYEVSKFVTTATNFSTTSVVNAAQVPTEGSGVYEQIAEEEFFFQLFEGMHDANLIQVPPVTMRSNVELTGTYSIMDIEFQTQSGTMSFINNPIARKQVRIAGNVLGGIVTDGQLNAVTATITGSSATGIREVLAAFCSPAPAVFS